MESVGTGNKGVVIDFYTLIDPVSLARALLVHVPLHGALHVPSTLRFLDVAYHNRDGSIEWSDGIDVFDRDSKLPHVLSIVNSRLELDPQLLAEGNLSAAIALLHEARDRGLVRLADPAPEAADKRVRSSVGLTRYARHSLGNPKVGRACSVAPDDAGNSVIDTVWLVASGEYNVAFDNEKTLLMCEQNMISAQFLERRPAADGIIQRHLENSFPPRNVNAVLDILANGFSVNEVVAVSQEEARRAVELRELVKLGTELRMFWPKKAVNIASGGTYSVLEWLYKTYKYVRSPARRLE